ncbi:MAG: hypothetical protein HC827_06945 [Cyanobacteria bacterium RM1_2_2]|nr:hypothetical protein [Cyanobacteria bacterium RM1_2_2]
MTIFCRIEYGEDCHLCIELAEGPLWGGKSMKQTAFCSMLIIAALAMTELAMTDPL